VKLIFQKNSIDLTSIGNVSLGVIPIECVLPWVFFVTSSKSGVTTFPVVTLGTNGPNYDNHMTLRDLSGIKGDGFNFFKDPFNSSNIIHASDELFLKVHSACNGTFTVNAFGFGYDINAPGPVIPITEGGTGQVTAQTARTALGTPGILSTITGIDGKTTGPTNLFTVPTGKTAIILAAVMRLTTAVSLTSPGRISIGRSGSPTDIFSEATLLGFDTSGETYSFQGQGNRAVAEAGATIVMNIAVAFGGTTATLACDLIGYLV